MPHTPKPWKLGPKREERNTFVRTIHYLGSIPIAEVYATSGSLKTWEGNGLLIEQAPALLDSLQELSAWMRFHTRQKDGTHEMLIRAVEAIKAAGEEPRDYWPCDHNEMVKNDDPEHAWKCAKCGYVYGK